MKNRYLFIDPPPGVQRAYLDNLALVPGNLLPQVREWLKLAGALPRDEMVIVVPDVETRQKQTVTTVATLLRAHGHQVRLIAEQELTASPRII
ncbi:MAG TPA: hypothetical protein VKX16_06680 [Chloroflexota bacterium]|nr:hypothetical protein [Chloroflexota bacterium]